MRTLFYGLAAGFFLALPVLAPEANAQSAEFQDWRVSCDTDNRCTTTTLDRNDNAGALSVSRLSTKASKWEVSVSTKEDAPSLFGPRTLRIAGQRLINLAPNRDFKTYKKSDVFFFIDTSSFSPLFRRMIKSRRLFLSFDADNGRQINASYSLKGLDSALLWIDEQQNKLGSRRTVGPPTFKSPTPQTPAWTVSDAKAIAKRAHEKNDALQACDISRQQSDALGTPVEPLDDQHFLVLIPCSTTALNTTHRLFVVEQEKRKAQLQLWAIYAGVTGWAGVDRLSNVSFDKVTNQLSMQHKTAASGKCGIAGKWQWAEGSFKMLDFFAKADCTAQTDTWPSILNKHSPQ